MDRETRATVCWEQRHIRQEANEQLGRGRSEGWMHMLRGCLRAGSPELEKSHKKCKEYNAITECDVAMHTIQDCCRSTEHKVTDVTSCFPDRRPHYLARVSMNICRQSGCDMSSE